MKTVYVETSIISYLTARAPRDIVGAAHHQTTIDWWETRRTAYDLYVSSVVEDEASRGDRAAAARRLAAIKNTPRLSITDEVSSFAKR